MIKKIYEKTINFMKEEYKFFIFMIIFYLIISFPLDVFITSGGGVFSTNNKVTVENSNHQEGEIFLSYVREYKGNILTYLLSYVLPNWEREPLEDYTFNQEDYEEMFQRSKIDLRKANSSAIKNAYELADKKITEKNTEYLVYAYNKDINDNFKIGDKIISIDNTPMEEFFLTNDFFKEHDTNKLVEVKLIRENKEKTIKINVKEVDGKKIIGLWTYKITDYNTDPKVEFNFEKDEGGPSGGLLTTLYLYNQLTEDDITNGLKIAGSGEITSDGKALEIGGVDHKVRGAAKKDIDIFIAVNGDNYDLAKKIIKEDNLDIKLIGVDSLEDTINQLKKLKN